MQPTSSAPVEAPTFRLICTAQALLTAVQPAYLQLLTTSPVDAPQLGPQQRTPTSSLVPDGASATRHLQADRTDLHRAGSTSPCAGGACDMEYARNAPAASSCLSRMTTRARPACQRCREQRQDSLRTRIMQATPTPDAVLLTPRCASPPLPPRSSGCCSA